MLLLIDVVRKSIKTNTAERDITTEMKKGKEILQISKTKFFKLIKTE